MPEKEIKKDKVVKDVEVDQEKNDDIVLSRETVESILERQKNQEAEILKLKKDNQKLLDVADKGRLSRWDAMNDSGELIRKANIGIWDGKVILGWKLDDKVWWENGVLREKQIITLFLDNGKENPTEKQMEYLFWYQNIKREAAEIIKQSKGIRGVETYTVRFEDGREFEIDVKFINP